MSSHQPLKAPVKEIVVWLFLEFPLPTTFEHSLQLPQIFTNFINRGLLEFIDALEFLSKSIFNGQQFLMKFKGILLRFLFAHTGVLYIVAVLLENLFFLMQLFEKLSPR